MGQWTTKEILQFSAISLQVCDTLIIEGRNAPATQHI